VPDAASARSLAAEWPPAAERLAGAFWPGPLTLVVSASAAAPAAATGEGTIALRPAADPVSSALLAAWGGPLFSTSANRRGEVAPVEVRAALVGLASARGAEAIELALEPAQSARAPAPSAVPSTIVDVAVHPPRLVRAGAIAEESIRSIVPDLETAP
jgi:L-threonylcarbamoyladenylate synthase